ncbi:cell division septal protein [Prochlorococcus sp. HOT_208_60]|nr:cell division septal protein [Prochlorococcus sp. HOT_208_60]
MCEKQKKIKKRSFFFLISFLFLTSLLSIKTLKKVDIKDIRISGSKLFSQNDLEKNSSLKFPIRLMFVKTNLLEKELKQNLSLKNVAVNRELFPFGLKVYIRTRIPIAHAERILNGEKILGFVDKEGIFINKQNTDKKNFNNLTIQVFGWKEEFKTFLSEIFKVLENYKLEIVTISFSPDGFLTIEEKDLRTIFLGYKPNLINYQLQIISNLKNEFKKNSFSIKIDNIDNIDLTNPNKPKIKVFKP